jgi:proline iminopeptidase
MILRDTSADRSNLDRAYENARAQTRVEINWDNFDRYWSGRIRDDQDLKDRWAEIIPLYDFEYDPVRSAEQVEAGMYRHEAHNWCFTRNMPGYDLKPKRRQLRRRQVPRRRHVLRHRHVNSMPAGR